MRSAEKPAVRRFALAGVGLTAIKIAAVAVFFLLLARSLGGL